MAPHSSGTSRESFEALCVDLKNALKGSGIVSLAKRTIDNVTESIERNKENQPIFSSRQTDELLSILDDKTGDACVRLDAQAFIVVCQTFLSMDRRQRPAERGMYLLAAALHHETSAANSGSNRNLQKKLTIITKDLFHDLLYLFIASDEEDHMRVWVGLILVLLLEECPESKNQMKRARDDKRRRLGDLVLFEGDEIARIVCGKLLTACINASFAIKDFWPKDADLEEYADFPKPQENSTWNLDFQKWIQAHVREDVQQHSHSPQRVQTRPRPSIFEVRSGDAVISVILSPDEDDLDREFSIYVQAEGETFDCRLDIPLKLVEVVWGEPSTSAPGDEKLSADPFDLVMKIRDPIPGDPFFLNASSYPGIKLKEIRLWFGSNNDRNALRNDMRRAAHLRSNRERGAESQRTFKRAGAHSQDSQESNHSKASQTAEVIHIDAEEIEEDEAEFGDDEANSPDAPPLDTGGGPNGSSKAFAKHVPSDEEDRNSLKSRGNENQRSAHLMSRNLLHSDVRGEIVAIPPEVNVGENSSVNDRRSPSSDILHKPDVHEPEPSRQFSRGKEKINTPKSNTQKMDTQEIDREQIAAAETVATLFRNSQEAPLQSGRGKSSQNKTVKKAAKTTKEENTVRDTAMKAKDRMTVASTQEAPQKPSTSTKDASSNRAHVGPTQTHTASIAKGKGREQLGENSGVSTAKSKSGILQSTEAGILEQFTSSITSPDIHDASTPKTVKNVALRDSNARAMNGKDTAMGRPSNLANTAAGQDASKPSATKTYSIKKPKPAITIAKPAAKLVRNGRQDFSEKSVIHNNSDGDLPNKDGTVSKKASRIPKALAEKSSNRSTAIANKKSEKEGDESEQSFWEIPSDKEIPKKAAAKSKGASKTAKVRSKAPAALSKAPAKKAAAKKSQSQPETQNSISAAPRNRRKAAVTASAKISQITSSDNESEDEPQDEPQDELDNVSEAGVEKTSQTTGSKHSKKPVKIPDAAPGKRKDVEATAASRSQTGNQAGISGAASRKSTTRPSQVENADMGEGPLDFQHQSHEVGFQGGPVAEHFDVAGPSTPAGSPAARIPGKAAKKGKNKMAAVLTDLLGDFEIDKNLENVRDDPSKKRPQLKSVKPNEERSKNEALPKRDLGEGSSMLRFSPSPEQFLTPNANGADQGPIAAQPEIIDLVSVPKAKKRDVSVAESSTSQRHLLEEQQINQNISPEGVENNGSTIKQPVTRKTPLRRSPRLLAQEAGVSAVLLDDRKARKTPIIAFGKNGPRNQGASSSKKVNINPFSGTVIDAPIPRGSSKGGMSPVKPSQRRRENEPGPSNRDGRAAKRTSLPPPPPEIVPMKAVAQKDSPPVLQVDVVPPKLNELNSFNDAEMGNDFHDPGTPSDHTDEEILDPHAVEAANLAVNNSPPQKLDSNLRTTEAHPAAEAANLKANNSPLQQVGNGLRSLAAKIGSGLRTLIADPRATEAANPDLNDTPPQKIGSDIPALEAQTPEPPDDSPTPVTRYRNPTKLPATGPKEKSQDVSGRAGARRFGTELDQDGFSIPKTISRPAKPPQWSSNAKAKPAGPYDEQEGYVAYEKIGDVESKWGIKDPFSDPQPGPKPSRLTERLRASKTKDIERRLPAPVFKPMNRSKSENDKSELAQTAEHAKYETPKEPVILEKSSEMASKPEQLAIPPKMAKGLVGTSERSAQDLRLPVPEKPVTTLNMARADVENVEHSIPDLGLPAPEESAPTPNMAKTGVDVSERGVLDPPLPVPEVPAIPPKAAKTRVENFEHSFQGRPKRKISFQLEEYHTDPVSPLRKPAGPIAPPELPRAVLGNFEQGAQEVRHKRKISPQLEDDEASTDNLPKRRKSSHQSQHAVLGNFEQGAQEVRRKRKISPELEDDEANTDNLPKRIKSSHQSQHVKLDPTAQELQRKFQKQATKLVPPVDRRASSRIEESRHRKVPSQIVARTLAQEAPEHTNEASYTLGSHNGRRLAQKAVVNPVPETEKQGHERRRVQEKPFAQPKEHTPKATEDPEKTLVNNASPTSSESSSGSSNLTGDESEEEASPEPTEITMEAEWGVELRSHDRPILESLYRIVNGLVSHLVGQREAIEDIVDDYIAGGTDLIEMLEHDHDAEKDRVLADFESAKARLSKSYINAQRTISKGSKEVNSSPISSLEKQWREQHDDLQSLISEGMGEDE